MRSTARAEISKSNRYWIDKHRHYELKHFCLQYPEWKKQYHILGIPSISSAMKEKFPSIELHGDPTFEYVIRRSYYADRIALVEKAAQDADEYLHDYILRAVTEGLSYTYLKTRLKIPCGRDMFYDRYRRFFWILDNSRN